MIILETCPLRSFGSKSYINNYQNDTSSRRIWRRKRLIQTRKDWGKLWGRLRPGLSPKVEQTDQCTAVKYSVSKFMVTFRKVTFLTL